MLDLSFLQNVDPVALAMLTFAIVGAVKFYTLVVEKNYKDAGKIAFAAIIGALCAYFALGISWFTGLLVGLNASGLITTLASVGKDSRAVQVDKANTVVGAKFGDSDTQ